MFSGLKALLLPSDRRLRTVKFGLLRGLTVPLNLQDQMQIYLGTWEREHYRWTHRLSRDIATYIDIGANRGLMTAYGVSKTGARRVLAFEPETRFHEYIKTSVEANRRGGDVPEMSIHGGFVSDRDDEAHVTIDRFRDEVEYPCFVKIDVDGAEGKVLRGAKRLLEEGDVRIVLETHSEELETECEAVLSALGLQTKVIDNAWWRTFLPERRPTDHNRWMIAYKSPHVGEVTNS